MDLQQLRNLTPARGWYDVGDQLRRHVYGRTLRALRRGDRQRDALDTPQAVRTRQARIRRGFLRAIGGLPPLDTPLHPQVVSDVEHQGLRIENVLFESRPDHIVTANLYLPPNRSGPTAAVLFLCGHRLRGKADPEFQLVCQQLASAGLVVLAMDPIGQGERLSYLDAATGEPIVHGCTAEHDHVGAQCLLAGVPLARYFLHDAMRAIDYLAARPEVDPTRIGVTGNSGGGTQTTMLMMTDPRLAAAAPATFVMDRRVMLMTGNAQDAEQIWPGWSAAGFDHEDFLIAMAPRPVRVLAVTWDYFPIEGTRRTVERAQRVYRLLDAEANLDLVEDSSRHRFTPALALSAAAFFRRHLLNLHDEPPAFPLEPLEPARLQCTQTGQVITAFPHARTIWHDLVDQLSADAGQVTPDDLGWLRRRVERRRIRVPSNVRIYAEGEVDGLPVSALFWWSQRGVMNHGVWVGPRNPSANQVVVAVWEGGVTRIEAHWPWVRETSEGGRPVLVLDPTGEGALTPRSLDGRDPIAQYGSIHRLNDDLVWLNDSLPAIRIWDLLRMPGVIADVTGVDSARVTLHARDRWAWLAALAARLDPSLQIEATGDASGPASGGLHDLVRDRYYKSEGIRGFILPGLLRPSLHRSHPPSP